MGKTVTGILLIAAGVALTLTGAGAQVGIALIMAGAATLAVQLPKFEPPETAASPIKVPIPPRVACYGRRRLFGAYALYENTDYSVNSDSFAPYAIDVWAFHDGKMDAIEYRYLGDQRVEFSLANPNYIGKGDNGEYGYPLVRWEERLGLPTETPYTEVIAMLPGKWTEDHRGDGVVSVATIFKPVSGDEFSERFPQGAAPASLAGRWQPVFDWRDPAQDVADPDTWVWSENAVLHLAHYRLVREKARKEPGAALPSGAALQDAWDLFFQPTIDYWTEAADVADEAVPLAAGGTEARYRTCFSHKLTDPHKTVIEGLTACFDGWTSPRADGALVVYAGKFYPPAVSIGPDEIASYSWQYGVADEESVNELKITYVSPDHDWNVVDADAWVDSADILERGAVRSQPLDFQVPSHGQARRMAKRVQARMMSPNRGSIATNVAGRIVRGERYINLLVAEAGVTFFEGVVEITQLERNMKTGGVTFAWVEITENIDAWNAATEEGEPAPVGTSITLVKPDPPEIDTAELLFDQSGADTAGVRIVVTLSGPSGDDLTWYLRWRRVDDAVWNEQRYSDVDSSAGVELISGFVPADEDLEVQVAYSGGTGALSDWSFPATEISSDTQATAPDAATTPALVEWEDRLVVATDPIPRARTYRWRFYLSDGTTLKRTIYTKGPEAAYTKAQAHADGLSRSYKVDVAGMNAAGTGTVSAQTATLSNAAPAAPTSVAFADGTSTSEVTFTASASSDAVGHLVAYSTNSSFDPMDEGASFSALVSPAYTPQLPAATYYGKVAAFDLWSAQPDTLNFSSEDTFAITPGSGGSPPAGGGGGGIGGGGGEGSLQ